MRRLYRTFACAVAFSLSAIAALAEPRPRSVLILDQLDQGTPFYVDYVAAFRATLNAGRPGPVTIYAENLDFGRFRGPEYQQSLKDHLREKYREKTIGVIVVIGPGAVDYALSLRAELWPDVPVVLSSIDEGTALRVKSVPNLTGTFMRTSLRDAVAAARALTPGLKQLALVGDPFEQQPPRRHFKREIGPLSAELEFIDLTGQPLAEVEKRVATLPDHAAIFYTPVYSEGWASNHNARDALVVVAAAANRPIVVDRITLLGLGAAGGFVSSSIPMAEEAARLALQILGGESATNIPFKLGDFTKPVFDWRELKRWNISESRLPPGSDIRFRPVGLWEQHRWTMISALAIVLTQAAMIAVLLFERRRRQVAEAASRRRFIEMTQMNRALTLSTMSSSIAHELNQPLGAILNNAEAAEMLLSANPPDIAQLKDILADIRKDDERAGEIINHLRDFLRKNEFKLRNVDMDQVVQDVLHMVEPEAAKSGVVIDSIRGPRALAVRADQIHLQQVLLNLALNGIDAMKDADGHRKMTFQTALLADAELEVSVLDTGAGIPNDKLKDIFESFVTTKQQGTGMGLSIARTIVETYGGRIWAENRQGGGAVFRFVLPLAEAQLA